MDEARTFGRHYIRTLERRNKLGYVVCAALVVAGFAGFSVVSSTSDWLAKHGVRATATVTATRLGKRQFFQQHIDVAFRTRDEKPATGRIFIGETDSYDLGQRVDILYDRARPSRVRLVHDDNLPPRTAFPIFAILFGLIGLVLPITRGRRIAAAAQALEGEPEQLSVSSRLARYRGIRARWNVRYVHVERPGEYRNKFTALTRRGWNLPDSETVTASVFSNPGGDALLVVHPESGSAAVRYE